MPKEYTKENDSSPENEWADSEHHYNQLIKDESKDSNFLRQHGLQKTLIRLIGDASDLSILDIGCGNGWLIDAIQPKDAHECDVVRHQDLPRGRNYKDADLVKTLPYQTNYFDVSVASLVFIWLQDIKNATREIARVTKPGGKVIISLMHPYFYRTGDIGDNDDFTIHSDLSEPFCIKQHRIGDTVGPFAYYYRPLNDYINELICAGLQVQHLEDWFVNIDAYKKYFDEKYTSTKRRTGKVPMYSFIVCGKD